MHETDTYGRKGNKIFNGEKKVTENQWGELIKENFFCFISTYTKTIRYPSLIYNSNLLDNLDKQLRVLNFDFS